MSELQTIKDEIMRRFQRPRTAADDAPGYAGGTLGEQLNRDAQSPDRMSGVQSSSIFAPPPQAPQPASQPAPTGQVLTPANQAAVTRPRSIFAPPQESQPISSPQPNELQRTPNPNPFAVFQRGSVSEPEPEPASRPRSVFEPPPGPDINAEGVADFRDPGSKPVSMMRDRRAEPPDNIAADSQYIRDLETKKPKWTDKAVDVLRGVNQAIGSNPNVFTPTERERDILKAQGMLGQDIKIQQAQTQQQLARMVPIYDAAGNVIGTAPGRTSAATQLRSNQIGNTVDDRRKASLLKEMNGVRDFDPADPANADYVKRYTAEFGTPPLKRTSGSLYVLDKGTDADGNATYNVIQKDTNTAREVTGGNLPEKSDQQLGREQQQLSREQRAAQFKASEEGRNQRAKARNAQSEKNATIMAGGVVSRMGDPTVHQKNMDEIDQDMDGVDKEISAITARTQEGYVMPAPDVTALNQLRQRRNALERERRGEREKLGKIESAQGNLRTRGGAPTLRPGGTGGSFNLGAWKADHPNATADQVQSQRSKAKARNLSIVE
jgi:hypothetical protein